MPEKIVIDSNIFIKSLRNEEGSSTCQELLKKWIIEGSNILVPSLFEFEVYAVLCARGESCAHAQSILTQWKGNFLNIVELEVKYITKAQEIVRTGNHKSGFPSFYDSIYHAIAILENTTFITADLKHVKKTESFGHIEGI